MELREDGGLARTLAPNDTNDAERGGLIGKQQSTLLTPPHVLVHKLGPLRQSRGS